MAGGMGVIDSSGKVGQAIQGMVNQAKAGNLGQARDHKLYLENLVKGMRLDHQRKEITRANQERTAAESALRDSQTKLQALNSKFLEEKYSNDVDRQDKLRRWDFNLKQVKYFEDRVAKGVTLTPGEYAQLQRARAALTGSEIADGTQTQIFDYGARKHLAGEYGQRADKAAVSAGMSAAQADQYRSIAEAREARAGAMVETEQQLQPQPGRNPQDINQYMQGAAGAYGGQYTPPPPPPGRRPENTQEYINQTGGAYGGGTFTAPTAADATAEAEAARQQQLQHTAQAVSSNQYAQAQRQTQRDLELGAVGADKLIEERISKRKSAAERFTPSEEMADLQILMETQGATKEQVKAKLDDYLKRTPQTDKGKLVQDFLSLYHEHKDVNPEVAKQLLDAAQSAMESVGKTTTSTGTSGRGTRPTGPAAKTNPDYAALTQKWDDVANDPSRMKDITVSQLVATNPFFSQAMAQIKSKVSIDKNNWFDDNVELTIEDANAAMKALIQTARDMQLPPTEFQNIMGRINKVAGMATDKVQGGADDFTRFATMLRSIKNFGNGDLWREYTNMISQLSGLRTNKDAEFKKMGWLPGTNDKEMNMSRWTLPNGIPVEQWTPNTVRRAAGPDPNDPANVPTPEAAPERGKEMMRFNASTQSFETVTPDSVEYDKGVPKRVQIDGKWEDVSTPYYDTSKENQVRMPQFTRDAKKELKSVFGDMKEGTRIVLGDGVEYTFVSSWKNRFGQIMELRVKDELGNVHVVKRKGAHFPPMYFPKDATIDEMNAAIRGDSPPARNRPKRQKRTGQADSTKPASERDAGQKKNIPVDSNMALTMTWDKLASGETRVKGEFFNATVVNLIPEGAKRRGGKPGVWDGDTIYGVSIEIPDSNFDGLLDANDYLDVDGKRVPLPEAWHTNNPDRKSGTFKAKGGNVYMSDAAIRLAGYQAWELKSTDEGKDGKAARQALLRMFQQGWVDAKEKDRFIFKVRGVGLPFGHGRAPADKRNPYIEPPVFRKGQRENWGRIVTDVYIVVGGTRKKVAELTFKNPVNDFVRQGHGEYFRKYR